MGLFFKVMAMLGILRVGMEQEAIGLDAAHMGAAPLTNPKATKARHIISQG